MCLAVPGRILESNIEDAVVDLQGNRLRISKVLTPYAGPGDWVLVHAGFAIATIDEKDALETWDYLNGMHSQELAEAAGVEEPSIAAARGEGRSL